MGLHISEREETVMDKPYDLELMTGNGTVKQTYEKELRLVEMVMEKMNAEVRFYSKDLFENEPLEGCESEWKHAKDQANTFFSVMRIVAEAVEEKKIGCEDEMLLMLIKIILNEYSGEIRYKTVREGIEVDIVRKKRVLASCLLRQKKGGVCYIDRVKICMEEDSYTEGFRKGVEDHIQQMQYVMERDKERLEILKEMLD